MCVALLFIGQITILCVLIVSFYKVIKQIWEGMRANDYGQIKASVLILIIMIAVLIACTWLSNPIDGISNLWDKITSTW